jgi:hypothetical protein
MARDSERVLTMSGAGEVPVQSLVKARITATGVKLSRRRGPRHCLEVEGSPCRCKRWAKGKGSDKVSSMCDRKGLSMGLRKFK